MKAFDLYAERYDAWYEKPFGWSVFSLEVECLKRLTDYPEPSLEIGVGSGRFAKALGVEFGVDTSKELLKIAKSRGIRGILARAEALPFRKEVFKRTLFVVSICFLQDPITALKEARRVLKEDGKLVLGLVLRESPWADFYLQKAKEGHPLYSLARFYSFEDIIKMLSIAGFKLEKVFTTLFEEPQDMKPVESREIREGFHPDGGFFCMLAGLEI